MDHDEVLIQSHSGQDLAIQALPRISTWQWLLATFCCFALSLLGFHILGHAHERPSIHPSYHGLLTNSEFFALMLMTWVTPLGFLCLGGLSSHLLLSRGSGSTTLSLVPAERCDDDDSATAAVRAQMQSRGPLLRNIDSTIERGAVVPASSQTFRALCFASLTVLCAVGVFLCWQQLIQPQVIFGAGFGPLPDQGDPLSGAYGYMLQTALLFCFGIFLSQTRQMFRNSSASTFRKDSFDDVAEVKREWSATNSPALAPNTNSTPLATQHLRNLSSSFDQTPSFVPTNFSANGYTETYQTPNTISFRSAQSLLKRPLHPNAAWSSTTRSVCSSFAVTLLLLLITFVMSCSLSSLWPFNLAQYFPFQSPMSLLPASFNDWFGPKFNIKLYTDVLVYYSFLLFIAMLAVASHYMPSLRRLLHTTVVRRSDSEGALRTIGEYLLWCSVIILFVFWTVYFATILPAREKDDVQNDDSLFKMNVAARVTGHVAVLCMSLMLFPTARNSMWESGFGCSFDRCIRFHRYLAQLCFALMSIHMLLWFIKWAIQGLFWQNLFVLDALIVSDGDPANNAHWDNFSVASAELCYLFVCLMFVCAYFFRRSRYQLFVYTHSLAIGVFVTVIIHAWSAWFFLAPPLLFWLLDKALRASRTRAVPVIALHSGCGNISRLILPQRALSTWSPHQMPSSSNDEQELPSAHFAGQFVWLNIPAISALEWHPFTISSSPNANALSFHIKATGSSDSFTHKLATLADNFTTYGPQMEVLVDGPYGIMPDFYQHHTLVLFAGGVGITPIISIVQQLYERARAAQQLLESSDPANAHRGMGSLRRVVLAWTVRSPNECATFAEQLWNIRQNNPFDAFEVSIHVTQASSQSSSPDRSEILKSQNPRNQPYPDSRALPLPYLSGRAPIAHIISSMPVSSNQVFVMACGPQQMVLEAQKCADAAGFDFHAEVFAF